MMKSAILYPYGPLRGSGCCRMLHVKHVAVTSAIYTLVSFFFVFQGWDIFSGMETVQNNLDISIHFYVVVPEKNKVNILVFGKKRFCDKKKGINLCFFLPFCSQNLEILFLFFSHMFGNNNNNQR